MKGALWFLLGAGSTFVAFIFPIVIAMVAVTVKTHLAPPPVACIVYVACGGPGLPACRGKSGASGDVVGRGDNT